MCDYSIHAKSRPAVQDEALVVTNFGTGTAGFASPADVNTAVCILPGTELAFDKPVIYAGRITEHKTAVFRQDRKDMPNVHHDMLEFPDGRRSMLTYLELGQKARVLQLPAEPKTEAEAQEQRRAEYVG